MHLHIPEASIRRAGRWLAVLWASAALVTVDAASVRPPPLSMAAAADSSIAQRALAAHNSERSAVGVPPLVWSEALAAEARDWAAELARSGRFEHSVRPRSTPPYGENLAATTGEGDKAQLIDQLIDLWLAERVDFVADRSFPDVSRSGHWNDVGHYTQMIWGKTRSVGCGLVEGRHAVLVCRYSPAGNVMGQPVY